MQKTQKLVCVKYEGISFCIDTETGQIATYITTPVAIKDCPEEVIQSLFKLLVEKGR